MLRHGQLHIQSDTPEPDGTVRAMTIIDAPGHGVIAWAGYLWPNAASKPPEAIELSDYRDRMITSFSAWPIAWAYFENLPGFAQFVPELRRRVELLISTGANSPGPTT